MFRLKLLHVMYANIGIDNKAPKEFLKNKSSSKAGQKK
jgi:hypothetical protein